MKSVKKLSFLDQAATDPKAEETVAPARDGHDAKVLGDEGYEAGSWSNPAVVEGALKLFGQVLALLNIRRYRSGRVELRPLDQRDRSWNRHDLRVSNIPVKPSTKEHRNQYRQYLAKVGIIDPERPENGPKRPEFSPVALAKSVDGYRDPKAARTANRLRRKRQGKLKGNPRKLPPIVEKTKEVVR